MSRRARTAILLTAFLAVSAGVTYQAHRLAHSLEKKQTRGASALSGKPAPDFSLPLLRTPAGPDPPAGERMALADYRGQIVFVSFWASWCRPCDLELPLLNQFYEAHRGQGVQVIAISTDTDRAAALGYAEKRSFALPMVWDEGGRVSNLYRADVLPTLVVIDPAGRIREVQRGLRMDLDSWLQRQVRQLSKQKTAPAQKGD